MFQKQQKRIICQNVQSMKSYAIIILLGPPNTNVESIYLKSNDSHINIDVSVMLVDYSTRVL